MSSSSSSDHSETDYSEIFPGCPNPLKNPYNWAIQFIIEDDLSETLVEEAITLLANSGEGSSQTRRRSDKKRTEHPRQITACAEKLQADYFDASQRWGERTFRRRFRMRKSLFLRIADTLIEQTNYFKQKYDAVGRKGLSPYQKITTALRLLAYDITPDILDEYLGIEESTGMECLKEFGRSIVIIFKSEFLREPNEEDIRRLNEENTRRGFPGMLGSIDCMHWKWKKCPTAWAGQFQSGHQKEPTIIIQAMASKNLRIWHAFFGMSGSNNDLNVLEASDLFHRFAIGTAPPCTFTMNNHQYDMGYYLGDGIYPSWACFVKSIPNPLTQKHRCFARAQEAYRKDVERAFGVLQARWHVLRGSARLWNSNDLGDIMNTCIILHNMIVEDESPTEILQTDFPSSIFDDEAPPPPPGNVTISYDTSFNAFVGRRVGIRNRETHARLQADLIEHIWSLRGNAE